VGMCGVRRGRWGGVDAREWMNLADERNGIGVVFRYGIYPPAQLASRAVKWSKNSRNMDMLSGTGFFEGYNI
jgi:hypothetical protein